MSIETTVTGRIAEPELRYTQQGKAVLDLRICATRRALNKNTNEWADDGEPLWVSAPFWERDAEYLAEILGKGSEITVTGTLAMEIYETSNGRGSKLVVRFPRFKGLVPKRQNPTQAPQGGVLRAEHTEPGWVHYPAHDRAPGWRAGPSRESWTARTLGTARPPKF